MGLLLLCATATATFAAAGCATAFAATVTAAFGCAQRQQQALQQLSVKGAR
jgi:hypothetical protein